MTYTTNLTVAQFELLDPLLPHSKTRGAVVSRHSIVNAILYQLKNGCQWRDLPSDFPNWQTVYSQFRRWRLSGAWATVLAELEKAERGRRKKTISELADRRFDVRQEHAHGKPRNTRLLLVQSDQRH